jgi:hypothetical protein
LACSVNDAVNVLPCATCAYLTAGFPDLCCLTGTTLGAGRRQTTDLEFGAVREASGPLGWTSELVAA